MQKDKQNKSLNFLEENLKIIEKNDYKLINIDGDAWFVNFKTGDKRLVVLTWESHCSANLYKHKETGEIKINKFTSKCKDYILLNNMDLYDSYAMDYNVVLTWLQIDLIDYDNYSKSALYLSSTPVKINLIDITKLWRIDTYDGLSEVTYLEISKHNQLIEMQSKVEI